MIIWLASYPRSGNTLTRIAVNALYGIKTHSMHADAPLNRQDYRVAYGFVINDKLKNKLYRLRDRPQRYFIKTHAVLDKPNYIQDEDKAIYIVRDGRDALVSRAHFFADKYAEYKGHFIGTLKRLVIEDIKYRPWSESVMTWAARPNTAYVRYEEMVVDPFGALGAAMAKLGVSIPKKSREMPKFTTLHDSDSTFFRRGAARAWVDEMPEELIQEFWTRNWRGMVYYGYGDGGQVSASDISDLQAEYGACP